MYLKPLYQLIANKRYIKYFLIGIILFLIISFSGRNFIVRLIFDSKCEAVKKRFGLIVTAQKVGFSGLRTLYVNKLSAVPIGLDTIFCISRGEMVLSISDLLQMRINPLEINLNAPKINLVGHKVNSNYNFLFKTSPKTIGSIDSIAIHEKQLQTRQAAIYNVLKATMGLTTASYNIENFILSYSDSTYSALVRIPKFESNRRGFDTQVETVEGGKWQILHLNGQTSKRKSSIAVKLSMSKVKMPLPLINHKLGVNLSFDSIEFKVIAKHLSRNDISLNIISSAVNLDLFTKRLSDQLVSINRGALNLDLRITPEYYLVDSTSSVELNGLKSSLYIKYQPADGHMLQLKLGTGTFPAQQLFDALPDGLFTNLKGIKTNGTIDFGLDFRVRISKPDSIYLSPNFITKGFGIAQYGYRNFSAINDTFSHDVYDEGYYIRTIHLGTSNKGYKTLNQISPFIINAIITSEDGGFFYNNGFDIDAFKYAISENLKQKRFVRGGSTITMQLIKNLYLNKNKNLFRKAEEYLIVWLMGSQGIVSKERMLEIYLNIIEWGPNIYGVNEACHYYFKRNPSEVTLDEAIFLSSVIPRPKKFKYLFEPDGNLKSFMEADFNFVANKMLLRGMISEEQFNSLKYNVELKGNAKEQLKSLQSVPIDSIYQDELRVVGDSTLLSTPKDVN